MSRIPRIAVWSCSS